MTTVRNMEMATRMFVLLLHYCKTILCSREIMVIKESQGVAVETKECLDTRDPKGSSAPPWKGANKQSGLYKARLKPGNKKQIHKLPLEAVGS